MALRKEDYYISEEDYLNGELTSEVRHEYVDGQVYAMVGVSRNHSRLTANLGGEFGNHLKGKPCDTHTSNFKVKIGSKYFYPDVMVECCNDGDYYTASPIIIIEVLSPSTRRWDETTKLRAYLNIPTLKECVLINQDVVRVEVFTRISDLWSAKIYNLGDEIHFESIDLTLSVAEIYARVDNEDMQKFHAQELIIEADALPTAS